MLKRVLLFLVVFIILLQSSLAQEPNYCLLVNEDNIEEAAQRILNVFSNIKQYKGDNSKILEAALSAVDSLNPGNNGYGFKEELKEEIARFSHYKRKGHFCRDSATLTTYYECLDGSCPKVYINLDEKCSSDEVCSQIYYPDSEEDISSAKCIFKEGSRKDSCESKDILIKYQLERPNGIIELIKIKCAGGKECRIDGNGECVYVILPNFPNYVKKIAENAKEAIKIQSRLKQEIEDKIGVAPMLLFGWLDHPIEEGRIIKSLVEGSKTSGLSQEFLTASVFQEGLNVFIEDDYYNNPDAELYSDVTLGLINFEDDVIELKRKRFLREDFNEGEEYRFRPDHINEVVKLSDGKYYDEISAQDFETYRRDESMKVLLKSEGGAYYIRVMPKPLFKNIDYALEAFGAVLAERRADFFLFAKSLGYDAGSLTEEQVAYWSYLSFNCGKGCMRSRIRSNGIEIPISPGSIEEAESGGYMDPNRNSKRVLATIELIQRGNLFIGIVT